MVPHIEYKSVEVDLKTSILSYILEKLKASEFESGFSNISNRKPFKFESIYKLKYFLSPGMYSHSGLTLDQFSTSY